MRILQLLIIIIAFSTSSTALACYQSSIMKPSEFLGNDGEIIQLSDGSVWEVKYEYNYLYLYNPVVTICPEAGKLIVNDKEISVEQLR